VSEFPKECKFCGMIRKHGRDRPCLTKLKDPITEKEKDKIEENCPAVYMMYA
jgi:hypothetical protein